MTPWLLALLLGVALAVALERLSKVTRDRNWWRSTCRIAIRSRDKAERERDAACSVATHATWEARLLREALGQAQRWRRRAEGSRAN